MLPDTSTYDAAKLEQLGNLLVGFPLNLMIQIPKDALKGALNNLQKMKFDDIQVSIFLFIELLIYDLNIETTYASNLRENGLNTCFYSLDFR